MNFIKAELRPLIVNGRIIYKEANRSFSIIRFKRRVIDFFPDLKKDRGWNYQLEYWLTHDKVLKRINQMKEQEEGIPLLLYIYPTK